MSNTKSSNQTAVPEAKGALDRFKSRLQMN